MMLVPRILRNGRHIFQVLEKFVDIFEQLPIRKFKKAFFVGNALDSILELESMSQTPFSCDLTRGRILQV